MGKKRIVVNAPTLLRRINRALPDDQQLRVNRKGTRAESQVGHYMLVDKNRNFLIEDDVNIETLGRQLDCLRPWEQVEED